MHIKLYPNLPKRLPIEPAHKMREWMNGNPHSYRCIPLSVANQIGWDIILDTKVVATWNGGSSVTDVVVSEGQSVAKTHFGSATLTFDVGYTWHTPENSQLLVMPVPNDDNYDKFQSLTALIETDKLKYPWFLTIRLVKIDCTVIEPGTKLCRIIPICINSFEQHSISVEQEPTDFLEYRRWQGKERDNKPTNVSWQKFYNEIASHTAISMQKVVENDTNPAQCTEPPSDISDHETS